MTDAVTISLVVTSPLLLSQLVAWLALRAKARADHEKTADTLKHIEGKVNGHQTEIMAALTASQQVVNQVATDRIKGAVKVAVKAPRKKRVR
jgi:hypothetical protein